MDRGNTNSDNSDNIKKNSLIFDKFINPLLNDSKAITSSYLFWKKNKNLEGSIEFLFEKLPFEGNFAFVAGVDEIINLLQNFKFQEEDINYLENNPNLSYMQKEFFEFLRTLNLNDIILYGMDNGSLVLSNEEPILILTGPLVKLKLLTFPISNLLSFSSLIATNSARMKLASELNRNIQLLEFGLRRAQGPLGGNYASKYSYFVFDAISNVLSGYYYNIPVKGTCAHAYIMSYQGEYYKNYKDKINEETMKFFNKCLEIRQKLNWCHTNLDELFSFASFSSVYPDSSNLLVDTYNTIESGVKNSIIVSLALREVFGNQVKGVRLDSGDLTELSKKARELFDRIAKETNVADISQIKISASNDINENSINRFNKSGHAMDIYGIGTNLVTCQKQPSMEIKLKFNLNKYHETKILLKENKNYSENDFNVIRKEVNEKIKKIKFE